MGTQPVSGPEAAAPVSSPGARAGVAQKQERASIPPRPSPKVAGAKKKAERPSRGRRALSFLVRIGRGMWDQGALDSAASMAFNFFLSLIPLLVLVGFMLGHLVRTNGVDVFMAPLLDTIPTTSAELVGHELQRMAGARAGSIAPLGVLTFFWLASSGVHHMMSVFEKAVQASRRRWVKQRAIALACVLAGLATLSFTSWGIFEADAAIHREAPRMPQLSISWNGSSQVTHVAGDRGPGLHESRSIHGEKKKIVRLVHQRWENLLALGLAMLIGVSCLAAFYRYAVEHPPGHERRAWPGAWAAFAAWLAVSWAFGNYVISLAEYAVYYGSLAAVAVLLVWLYLTSLSLLLGAEVNAILEGVRDAPASAPDAPTPGA
jgi:membrane protein